MPEQPSQSLKTAPPASVRAALATALVVAIVLVFGQSVGFDFVDWDDPTYVSNNPRVLEGLSVEGLRWSLTTVHASIWLPLSWLSHMLDVELFGTWAGGHHLTNVVLHAVNAVLLLLWLGRATGRPARAAVVAAIWALHPLRVESVAWVTERKDVLSALFFLSALLAYDRWIRNPRAANYAWVTGCLLLSLLAKPMAVTLPVVLLLLDSWPYDRLRRFRASLAEKLPWFGICGALAVLALWLVSPGAGVVSDEGIPVHFRIANAVVSYLRYLGLTLWPVGLSALYPHPNLLGGTPWSLYQIVGAGFVLAALTAWALKVRRSGPATTMGWAWYLVMLLPVIGLVQAGEQALADRFTYLPQIGLLVAMVWAAADLAERRGWLQAARGRSVALAATLAVLVLATLASRQCTMWRDSETLFARSLEATPRNPIVLRNLARARRLAGNYVSAEELLRRALELRPIFGQARIDLAYLLADLGRFAEAQQQADLAIANDPKLVSAYLLRGELLTAAGKEELARHEYAKALALEPDSHLARLRLGNLERRSTDNPELTRSPSWADAAIGHYRRMLSVRPDSTRARMDLGVALRLAGRLPEAVQILREVTSVAPPNAEAHYELAAALAEAGDRSAAEIELAAALTLRPTWIAPQKLREQWGSAPR